jgi:hypothetical protein
MADRNGVGDVEDELGRSLRRLSAAPNRRIDGPAEIPEATRRGGTDSGRSAGYEDSRDAATSARCSRPYPSAPSSHSARL